MKFMDPTCLCSLVENTSDQDLYVGCIPPHGRRMLAGEQVLIFGSVLEAMYRGDFFGNRRAIGLLRAMQAGLLSIVYLPAPICYDAVRDATKMLTVSNNNVTVADPCFVGSASESEDQVL